MTEKTMVDAILQFKRDNGNSQAAVRELLQRLCGVNAISEVPSDMRQRVIDECAGRIDSRFTAKAKAAKIEPSFHSQAFIDHCYQVWNRSGTEN